MDRLYHFNSMLVSGQVKIRRISPISFAGGIMAIILFAIRGYDLFTGCAHIKSLVALACYLSSFNPPFCKGSQKQGPERYLSQNTFKPLTVIPITEYIINTFSELTPLVFRTYY